MNKILLLLILFSLFALQLQAQIEMEEETPSLQLSGSIDAYYRANFSGDFDDAPATSFANLPGFALGMANLVGSYETGKVGMVADLVFGPRGEDATFLSGALRPSGDGLTNSSGIINQLYAYWNVTDKTTLTIGNFNTFLGYEVISPTGNFNYSTSYMFSYGPFSHTGLKADFALSDEWSLMLAVMNPTDATEFNPTNDYVGGAQLGYDFGSGSAYLNTIISDGFFQIDLTAGVDLTDKVYLGVNATTNDDFAGAALYLQAATSDNFKIGLRGEYFQDDSGVAITAGESVFDFTVSGSYTIDNLTIIPEFRIDAFSDDAADGLSSFVLAAVYGF
ncbi:MAG: outer membrane beta-barrel protein [Bacteroidota bacterium]